jgi:hypothetical protein
MKIKTIATRKKRILFSTRQKQVANQTCKVSDDQRYTVNITDLTDIWTVNSPNIVGRKLKIPAQTDEPF